MAQSLHIVSGFKDDCSQLLSLFKKEDDIRFDTFCKCWQEMKFSLVFLNRESFADLLEFCEEALHIAKQFVLSPYNFKERIGGLYLLYGLYYKMPLDNLVKIRLTLSDLNQLTQLQQEIRVGEHLDANFILSKMFVDNAFQFCLFAKEMSLQKQFKATKKHKDERYENVASIIPFVHQMGEPEGVLNKLRELTELYESEKANYSKHGGPNGAVKLFRSDSLEDAISELQTMNQTQIGGPVKQDPVLRKKLSKSTYKLRPVLGRGFDTSSEEESEQLDETQTMNHHHQMHCKTELNMPMEDATESDNDDYKEHPSELKHTDNL